MEVEGSIILELLDVLLTPGKFQAMQDSGSDVLTFDVILQNNLEAYRNLLLETKYLSIQSLQKEIVHVSIPDEDCRWQFVQSILDLFQCLTKCMSLLTEKHNDPPQNDSENLRKEKHKPSPSPDILSFTQQKSVMCGIQFVVTLGICPYLDQGVGFPTEKRSEFAAMIQRKVPEGRKENAEMEMKLYACLKALLPCIPQPSLGTLILSRHLGDILAALLQICCKPQMICQPQSALLVSTEKISMENCLILSNEQKAECLHELEVLVINVYQPLLVKELIMLQGAPPSKMPKKNSLSTAPTWLRKECGRLLSKCLTRPNGVMQVLRGLLDGTDGASSMTMDWRKCDAAARIVANCPQHVSADNYYQQLAPQLINLLHVEDKLLARQFLRVTVTTISVIWQQNSKLAELHIIRPLLQPLRVCLQPIVETGLLVSEPRLSQCVLDMHKLYVVGCEPNCVLLTSMRSVLGPLFELYCASKAGVTHLRQSSEQLLVTYIQSCNESAALEVLNFFAFGKKTISLEDEANATGLLSMNSNLKFSPGNSGGMCVVADISDCIGVDWDSRALCLVELILAVKCDNIAASFFLANLKMLTELIGEQVSSERHVTEHQPDTESEKLARNLMVLSMLAHLTEQMGPTCFSSPAHILDFVKVTLERGICILEHTEDAEFGMFENETITMAMGLLTAVLAGEVKMGPAERAQTKTLLPLLQQLADCHEDSTVQEMALDLCVAIATHGLVESELLKHSKTRARDSKSNKSVKVQLKKDGKKSIQNHNKPLIEEIQSLTVSEKSLGKIKNKPAMDSSAEKKTISPCESSDADKEGGLATATSEKISSKEYGLQNALDELLGPLVPVRGHALIALRHLVEKKDTETLEKTDMLVAIFKENLRHEDTYIYLAAVQGLAVLGECHADSILPLLLEEYGQSTLLSVSKSSSSRCAEVRMKVGEVLVKVIRSLGDIAPVYRDTVLACVLHVAHDDDPLLRASSLCNLGELCKLLHFSLGNVLYQVMECVEGLLKGDPDADVRKAAAQFTSLLLQGLGADALKVLREPLGGLYRVLKQRQYSEADPGVCVHVQLALQELDSIMKDFLFPQQQQYPQKKIHISSLPPDPWT